MANINTKNLTLYLGLILSFLFTLSIAAESRLIFGFGSGIARPPIPATPTCNSVYGVQSGDTCFGVTQMFKLTTEFFNSINPNLNCTALFVGQWLCVNGIA